jgi:hypothetical protein
MNGADGDDTYDVGGLGDVVTGTSSGVDTVVSYISGADRLQPRDRGGKPGLLATSYALPPAVMNGNGNALDNRITANLSANAIDGGAGNDTLDFNIVGSLTAADTLSGGLGNDMVANDTLLADITGATPGADQPDVRDRDRRAARRGRQSTAASTSAPPAGPACARWSSPVAWRPTP